MTVNFMISVENFGFLITIAMPRTTPLDLSMSLSVSLTLAGCLASTIGSNSTERNNEDPLITEGTSLAAMEAIKYINHKSSISDLFSQPDGEERLLQLQLAWDGEIKSITSIIVGSSPEYDFALYTLYFIAGRQRNRAGLLGRSVEIRYWFRT